MISYKYISFSEKRKKRPWGASFKWNGKRVRRTFHTEKQALQFACFMLKTTPSKLLKVKPRVRKTPKIFLERVLKDLRDTFDRDVNWLYYFNSHQEIIEDFLNGRQNIK